MSDALERLKAALATDYVVERQAGQGGMATVYMAHDLKHDRRVAIKVFLPELASELGGERFLREINLSAGLQHPHIVPVYDSGEVAGLLYYVMPFVEGESLGQRIEREGPLPIDETVQIIQEAASALAFAHERGVIHRDIKPDNIMLSGGVAVVVDFGIAKAIHAATDQGTTLTGVGLAIGTPAYMSPEQATAEEDIGERSDVYSLACVLYECLTGKAPFAGKNTASIITQILTAPRPHPQVERKDVPSPLDEVVVTAMATDPDDRYPTVTEFATTLSAAERAAAGSPLSSVPGWVMVLTAAVILLVLGGGGWMLGRSSGGGTVVSDAETIAVMPFNVTGPDIEYMGEGMVDLLSTTLDGVEGISAVEPRTVLKQWRDGGGQGGADLEGALDVANELDAGSVLLGSVVAVGGQVRLSAELHARDGSELARAQVEGPSDSVLSLVDALSLDLTKEIWLSSEPVPALRVAGLTTESLDAMQEYLVGERFYRRIMWDSAAAAFGRAVDLDSTFAMAHFRLASVLGWTGRFDGATAPEAMANALRYAGRLPAKERSLVTAYGLWRNRSMAAIDSIRSYVTRNPTDPEGWYLLAEMQYHNRVLYELGGDELRAPFDSVLALEPSLVVATLHPLQMSISELDREAFDRYIAILRRAGADAQTASYGLAGDLVFGIDPDVTLADVLEQRGWGAMSALRSTYDNRHATSDTLVAQKHTFADRMSQGASQLRLRRILLGEVLSSTGRLAEALAIADSMVRQNRDVWGMVITPIYAGYAPEDYAPEWRDRFDTITLEQDISLYLLRVYYALVEGNAAEADSLIQPALALDSSAMDRPGIKSLFRAADGWRMMVLGDTTAGLQRIESSLLEGGAYGIHSAPIRFQWILALLSNPATRAEGLRRSRYGMDDDTPYLPFLHYVVGRASEAAGDSEGALAAYGQFLRLWDKADPSVQEYVDEAREVMARLTAEKSNASR